MVKKMGESNTWKGYVVKLTLIKLSDFSSPHMSDNDILSCAKMIWWRHVYGIMEDNKNWHRIS